MRIRIDYRTEYHYEEAVSFSPHVMRLLPRQDHSLRLRHFDFATNADADVQTRRDVFDNTVIHAFYPETADSLLIEMDLEVEVHPVNPFHFLLDGSALDMPFEYHPSRADLLQPFLTPPSHHAIERLPFWSPPSHINPAPTVSTLVELNRLVAENIAYERREEGGARSPAETLEAARGACRDIAVLFASVLRTHGIACRLASGYLCEFETDAQERRSIGSMHAWTEAYLPGAGWVGFDPTNGMLCDHNFITTAVAPEPPDIAPVSGNFYADHRVPSSMDYTLEITHLD